MSYNKPLEGIKIVEISTIVTASLATMMMNCSESLLKLFMTRDPNGMWATHAMQSVITFGKTFVIK